MVEPLEFIGAGYRIRTRDPLITNGVETIGFLGFFRHVHFLFAQAKSMGYGARRKGVTP